ncbi:MAG: hypothetical protein Q7S16_04945 [bacterium]|nr:hypothetical protein [bacterium]
MAYFMQELQVKIRVIVGLSWYDRERMLKAIEESKDKGEEVQKEVAKAILNDLKKRPFFEIRLRPQRDETM